MADNIPRGPDGLQGCAWCGAPIKQPATGRRREYCKPGHVEMAYRARSTQRRVAEALKAAGVDQPPPPAAPVGGEPCPYCLDVVTGLVDHLGVCPERPGFIS